MVVQQSDKSPFGTLRINHHAFGKKFGFYLRFIESPADVTFLGAVFVADDRVFVTNGSQNWFEVHFLVESFHGREK